MNTVDKLCKELGEAAGQVVLVQAAPQAALKRAATQTETASQPWFPRIGQPWPGQGIYAGIVRGEPGQPDWHLFVSADARTSHTGVTWGPRNHTVKGACNLFDGQANTAALVFDKHEHPAAKWAAGLAVDNHRDWYLPSIRELQLCCTNLRDMFEGGWYWSSTQYSPDYAWFQVFANGNQGISSKDDQLRARAVRRFLIT